MAGAGRPGRDPFDRPFPLGPLLEAAQCSTMTELGDRLGVPHRSLYRYRDDGLTWEQADRAAIALGRHPLEVWPTWLDGVELGDEEEVA